MYGLDSRHGLFQFVGARDAIHHNKRDDWSVIDDVLDRLERQHGADADRLIIAGRYAITAMERMPTIESGHRCYKLTAHDVKSPNSGKTMLITEADLNYRTDILRFREIERANAMMEAHTRESRRSGPGNSAQDPAVLDHFGWGSNAALICYREAIRRLGDIDKVEQIDDLIKEIVADETRVRGQFFLGPREQIAELKIAIIRRFHELNQDTSGEDSAAASNDKVGQVRVRPDEKSVKPKKRVRFADEVLRHTETGTNAL